MQQHLGTGGGVPYIYIYICMYVCSPLPQAPPKAPVPRLLSGAAQIRRRHLAGLQRCPGHLPRQGQAPRPAARLTERREVGLLERAATMSISALLFGFANQPSGPLKHKLKVLGWLLAGSADFLLTPKNFSSLPEPTKPFSDPGKKELEPWRKNKEWGHPNRKGKRVPLNN